MKTIKTILLISVMILLVPAMRAQQWSDLQFSLVSADTVHIPYMGKKPECKVRVINTGSASICDVDLLQCNASSSIGINVNPFPNFGQLDLHPGDTTWIKCWLEHADNIPVGNHNWTMNFVLHNSALGNFTYSVNMVTVKNTSSNNIPSGNTTISGNVYYPNGGPQNNITIRLYTHTYKSNPLQAGSNGNGVSFTASLPGFQEGMQWYIGIYCQGYRGIFREIDPDSVSILSYTLSPYLYSTFPQLTLTDTIHTQTGFWRGTASESEQTIALFPGQENWLDTGSTCQQDSMQKLKSRVYKISFNGTVLWTHATGWEAWAGDMTDDGSLVAYCIEPYNVHNCGEPPTELTMLDGATGNVLWTIIGPYGYEFKEIRFSHNGQYLAAGQSNTGKMHLFDAATGNLVWTVMDSCNLFGQVRHIIFDPTDTYMYVSSGDSYVRKLLVQDGSTVWETYAGSWAWVNGFNLSPDGSKLGLGGKCGDICMLDASTGEVLWNAFLANFNDLVFSPDGSKVATYTGQVFDANTGQLIGFNSMFGMPYFYDNDRFFRCPNEVKLSEYTGMDLYGTQTAIQSGMGINAGENTQWAYYSPVTGNIIIAARDMIAPPQSGIAIYTMQPSAVQHTAPAPVLSCSIRPNPVSPGGELLVSAAVPAQEELSLTVFDLNGRVVMSRSDADEQGEFYQSFRIDTSKLDAGMYFVRLSTGGASRTEKLIVH